MPSQLFPPCPLRFLTSSPSLPPMLCLTCNSSWPKAQNPIIPQKWPFERTGWQPLHRPHPFPRSVNFALDTIYVVLQNCKQLYWNLSKFTVCDGTDIDFHTSIRPEALFFHLNSSVPLPWYSFWFSMFVFGWYCQSKNMNKNVFG